MRLRRDIAGLALLATILLAVGCGADSSTSTETEVRLEFEQAFVEEHAAQPKLISAGES